MNPESTYEDQKDAGDGRSTMIPRRNRRNGDKEERGIKEESHNMQFAAGCADSFGTKSLHSSSVTKAMGKPSEKDEPELFSDDDGPVGLTTDLSALAEKRRSKKKARQQSKATDKPSKTEEAELFSDDDGPVCGQDCAPLKGKKTKKMVNPLTEQSTLKRHEPDIEHALPSEPPDRRTSALLDHDRRDAPNPYDRDAGQSEVPAPGAVAVRGSSNSVINWFGRTRGDNPSTEEEHLIQAEIVPPLSDYDHRSVVMAKRDPVWRRHQWCVGGSCVVVVLGIILAAVLTSIDLEKENPPLYGSYDSIRGARRSDC